MSPALAGRLFTPEPLEQVVDKGLVSLFPPPLYECPIVSASFVKLSYLAIFLGRSEGCAIESFCFFGININSHLPLLPLC